MRLRRLSSLFVPLVSLVLLGPAYLACQLVDPASDLEGDDDGGAHVLDSSVEDAPSSADSAADVTIGDATAPGDANLADGIAPPSMDGGTIDAAPFCLGKDASVCDGFDVNGGVANAFVARFGTVNCSQAGTGQATIDVADGQLAVQNQTNNGNSFLTCVLESDPISGGAQFTLQYDFEYQAVDSDAQASQLAIVSSVKFLLPSADDAGMQDVDFQLLFSGTGIVQYLAIPWFPNGALTPPPQKGNNFPTYHLAGTTASAPWVMPGAQCRITLTGNALTVTGTATATCGDGVLRTLAPSPSDDPPPGLVAPATLSLGYSESEGQGTWPVWSLSYDNLLFTVLDGGP